MPNWCMVAGAALSLVGSSVVVADHYAPLHNLLGRIRGFDRAERGWEKIYTALGSRLHFWCFRGTKRPQGLLPQGPQVAKWEQELNVLVYALYKLTDDEIYMVEEGNKVNAEPHSSIYSFLVIEHPKR